MRENRVVIFLLEDGSLSRTRTCDPMINSHLLYQLSYRGISSEYAA